MSTPVKRRGTLDFESSVTTEPPSLLSPKPLNDSHDRTISSLNTAVQLISLVNNFLTPIPLAKEVLGSVAGILDIIKTTYANQGDFQDVAEQCQTICLTVWQATNGTPGHQVDDRVQRALSTLQSSVMNIQDMIEKKTKSNIVSKVFHSTLNKDTIAKWKTDLDRCLVVFNTDLNISTNAKLDELLNSFQEFRATLQQPSNNPDPNELPFRPLAFFGRNDIVQDTVKHLTEYSKVALIGPGGIGKSSIARAVINDDALAAKFHQKRFFVRFDDMDSSQVTFTTFLDRIARVLGYNSSFNAYNVISRTLSSSDTLLVLDNSETFLDAPVDGGRIADAIDDFGARPNVAILLTTRTTVLPPNLNWIRTRVPSLEEDAACKTFKMFYTPPIETSTLVKLLSAIDFHPLSINLLAQAAVQNEWSPDDLIAEWNRQRTSLLEVGAGKIQSLAVTIETSLSSPSIRKFGDTLRHFLQIIAFLPQGVNTAKGYLFLMFPEHRTQVVLFKEALCKQSIAYLNGNFITVLAPIRLYITSTTQISNNPLFTHVLSYYDRYQTPLRVQQEDLNAERIFTYWLSSGTATTHVLESLTSFIDYLREVKPRSVSAMRKVVSSLDPNDLVPSSKSWIAASRAPQRRTALMAKAKCLFSISLLMRWIGQMSEAEESQAEARALLLRVKPKRFAVSLNPERGHEELVVAFDDDAATMLYKMGNYRAAEEAMRSVERVTSRRKFQKSLFAVEYRVMVCHVQMVRGKPGMSQEILDCLPTVQKLAPSRIFHVWLTAGTAELYDGHLDRAKEYFQRVKELCNDDEDDHFVYLVIVLALAEVAYLQGDKIEWRALRTQAFTVVSEARNKASALWQ
ncbi:hypothetical protein H0H92_007096, partial [Tricholoma furcatifolium]